MNSYVFQVRFQLKRLTDNARSNSLPFEYYPEYQGTVRKPLPDLSLLSLLLNEKRTDANNNRRDKTDILAADDTTSDDSASTTLADANGNLQPVGVPEPGPEPVPDGDPAERSLDDLLDQVAELDEIYSENRTRLENMTLPDDPEPDAEEFNDAGTYTSLQLAFRNPVPIADPDPDPDPSSYEDVQVRTHRGPIVEFAPLKRDPDDERAPPLPPKRVRKSADSLRTSQTSVNTLSKIGEPATPATPVRPPPSEPDRIVHENRLGVARSEPALPPVKKRSFFSRLFRRRDKSPAPPGAAPEGKESRARPVGRSVSSVSGQRPPKYRLSVSHASLKDDASTAGLSYADSITHISLHGDGVGVGVGEERPPRGELPPTDGSTILVAESVLALDASAFKKLQDDLELTDAEHYALYMAVAPRATASEFDETSCYYSPVDAAKFHNH